MKKGLVVITGASSGIGEAVAKRLNKQGYPLLLLARRVERLNQLGLDNAMCCKLDVTDRDAFKKVIAEAESVYGPVDCLVNNAGVMLLGLANEQDPKEWEQMYDVNIKGLLNGIHTVLDGMIERQSGTVINISSIAGRKTFPNHSVYCGTKFAVHAMTENMREEVAKHNVRMITIAPGAVETELLSHTSSDDIKSGYENWKQDIGGALDADTIAQAVEFAYTMPQNVCVREIVVAATKQEP